MNRILNVRATVVASLAFAGLVASIPTQALELYNNSTKVCDFSTFNFDGARLSVACGGVLPPSKTCLVATTASAFSIESPTSDHTQVGTSTTMTRKVRFNRGGTCAGAYDLNYNIAAVNLTGWSFNGGTTNGKVHFNEGDEYVDVDFLPGSSEGWFLVQLSAGTGTAIPVPPAPTVTVAKQDWWMDIKANVVVTNPPPPPPVGIPQDCPAPGASVAVEDIPIGLKTDFALKNGEAKAYGFTMPQSISVSDKVAMISTYEVPAQGGADHQIVVSHCPGDFSTANNVCNTYFAAVGFAFTMGTTDFNRGQCNIAGGQKYYINLRYVTPANQPSCSSATGICHEYITLTVPQ